MKRNKGGRPRGPGRKLKFDVSVSRGTYRLVQAAAIVRGVSMRALVDAACKDVGAEVEG